MEENPSRRMCDHHEEEQSFLTFEEAQMKARSSIVVENFPFHELCTSTKVNGGEKFAPEKWIYLDINLDSQKSWESSASSGGKYTTTTTTF